MTWKRTSVIPLLLFMFCLPAVSPSYASDHLPLISSVEVEGLSRIEEDELVDLISLRAGSLVDRSVLAAGIRRAFRKGIFYDIQALSHPDDNGGVTLTYRVEEIPVIRKIIIEGNNSISTKAIKKNIGVKKGEDLRRSLVDSSVKRLLKLYRRKGFHDAGVEVLVESMKKPAEVTVRIKVNEGKPLKIKNIVVQQDLSHLMTLSVGDTYDMNEVDKSITRISDYYRKRNFINPVIGPALFSNDELEIPVLEGQRLEVYFEGASAISTKNLMKEVPFMDSGEVSAELVLETETRIRRVYESKGYPSVQVRSDVQEDGNLIRVVFYIDEGKKVIVRKVVFSGINVQPETLKKVISLKENKPFDPALLVNSKESLIRFYNAIGYLQMKVVEMKKEFQNEGSDLAIEFDIQEGSQTTIENIEITGNQKLSMSLIRESLQVYEGLPYDAVNISDARQRVISFYKRHGYLHANVKIKRTVKEGAASLVVTIGEGKQSIIGNIIISGNKKTKQKIIKREFTFEEGEPYNRDEMRKTKQRLYRLGIFNEVTMKILKPYEEGEDTILRDMLVTVKEANAGTVEVGAGYGDYERIRGGLDISYRNLGGYNREIGLRIELSSVAKKFVLNFREPWFLNKPDVPLNLYLLKEKTESIDTDSRDVLYKIDRLSFIAGVQKDLLDNLNVGLGYEYSRVDTTDVEPGVVLSKEDVGTIGISAVVPSIVYDTRDSALDATRGSFQRVMVKWAANALFSEATFIKGTFRSSWYFPVAKKIIAAVSFSGGAAYGYDGPEDLPLVERYFLGGGSTVRGYKQNFLGPKGRDGSPTGGNIFALTNWEVRLPVGKGFGLVPFVDAGNVWQTFDDFDGELKFTIGMGLRYRTPVGPVRIDYGHKLNRDSGESSGEVHFSFGQAF